MGTTVGQGCAGAPVGSGWSRSCRMTAICWPAGDEAIAPRYRRHGRQDAPQAQLQGWGGRDHRHRPRGL